MPMAHDKAATSRRHLDVFVRDSETTALLDAPWDDDARTDRGTDLPRLALGVNRCVSPARKSAAVRLAPSHR